MQTKFKLILFVTATGISLLAACSKNDPSSVTTTPTPQAVTCKALTDKTGGKLSTKFEYNSDGKLSKIENYDTLGMKSGEYTTYEYGANTLTVKGYYNNSLGHTEAYSLNSKGYAIRMIYSNASGFVEDTTDYTYDANDYLIEAKILNKNTTTYTVVNGNTTKSDDGASSLTYEYSTQLNALTPEIDIFIRKKK